MTGMNSYDQKQKRAMRRRNHVARDLRSDKYRQRRVESEMHKKPKYPIKPFFDDFED